VRREQSCSTVCLFVTIFCVWLADILQKHIARNEMVSYQFRVYVVCESGLGIEKNKNKYIYTLDKMLKIRRNEVFSFRFPMSAIAEHHN
jgi:hypothetical protein